MLPYHPALRFKQGEYTAAARLARDIRQYVEPRFIIPPPKDKDPEKGQPLTADEIAYLTGERVRKHWLQPAFLDIQFVADLLNDDGIRKLFRLAQDGNDNLAPVVDIKNLFNPIYRNFLRRSAYKLGIHIPYENFDASALLEGVRSIGCVPNECVLFLDFTGMPFQLNGIKSSVAGLFDELGMVAQWGRIVFQGSAYPVKNPADDGGRFDAPREEWNVFHAALEDCSISPERIGFGDFGADCGEIKFSRKTGGAAPIRHLRYTSETSTIVMRGKGTGAQGDAMRDVCKRILESGHFAGQAFSFADDEIWRIANGLSSPGTPTTWRGLNMNHHMTRVVRDLGALSGIFFANGPQSVFARQRSLFPEIEKP